MVNTENTFIGHWAKKPKVSKKKNLFKGRNLKLLFIYIFYIYIYIKKRISSQKKLLKIIHLIGPTICRWVWLNHQCKWMGAVRMRVQTTDKKSKWFKSSLHDSSPSFKILKSENMCVRKKQIHYKAIILNCHFWPKKSIIRPIMLHPVKKSFVDLSHQNSLTYCLELFLMV